MKLLTLCLLGALAVSTTYAQKFSVTDIRINDQEILVNYNLEEVPAGNDVIVQLYCSVDNFVAPLKLVSGDAGTAVVPGTNKTILWKYHEEYPDVKGKISVEVRGKAFVPVARFKDADFTQKALKRGAVHNIEWRPGNNKVVDIEVFQGSTRVQGESNVNNSGAYSLHLLPNLKPGNNYRIKISDSRNPEEYSYSKEFEVKRKIPLALQAVPVAILAAGVVYIVQQSGGSQPQAEIPGVPGIPGSN